MQPFFTETRLWAGTLRRAVCLASVGVYSRCVQQVYSRVCTGQGAYWAGAGTGIGRLVGMPEREDGIQQGIPPSVLPLHAGEASLRRVFSALLLEEEERLLCAESPASLYRKRRDCSAQSLRLSP